MQNKKAKYKDGSQIVTSEMLKNIDRRLAKNNFKKATGKPMGIEGKY